MSHITTAHRNALPASKFALPAERKYPVDTKARARNAIARVSQFGTPEEKAKVRGKVRRLFSTIKQSH